MSAAPTPLPSAMRVHVVDDDQAMRRSLALLFRSARIHVETYASAATFLHSVSLFENRRGCVVTALQIAGTDAVALLHELRRRSVFLPLVVMTAHGDVATAVRAMKAGAFDVLEKPFAPETVLEVVRGAAALPRSRSETTIAGHNALRSVPGAAAKLASLSSREREVLHRLVAGKPNKVVASELGLSPRTVEMHRANMMQRLGARTFSEVVRLAVVADLVAQSSVNPNDLP